jgi:hypothetical protein
MFGGAENKKTHLGPKGGCVVGRARSTPILDAKPSALSSFKPYSEADR